MLEESTQAHPPGETRNASMRASALPQLRLEPLSERLQKVIKRSDLGAAHVRTLSVEAPTGAKAA